MIKRISLLFLICFATLSTLAQTEKYTAPVKWERYKVSNQNVSILMPRLPVMISKSEFCQGKEIIQYAAYTDQTIYGLTSTSKRKNSDYCKQIKESKEFNGQSFKERISEIKNNSPESKESLFELNKLSVTRISGNSTNYWLINDAESERWFEIWVIDGNEEKTEVKNFIKSIEISKNPQGIEIGSGAERTLGDEFIRKEETKTEEKSPIVVAFKPQPRYTEEARRNETTGTVTLKVTFASNGAIGSVTPVSGLPFGLTEQAIFAAQRIIFIPPRVNGIPYSVSKTISYNFTIY